MMVNSHFDVFLDSVCKDFVEYFCINVYKWDWSEVIFPCSVFFLVVFRRVIHFSRVIVTSKNELGSVPSDSILWNSLESNGIRSSINVWCNAALSRSGPGLFLVGRLLMTASISFGALALFRWLIWPSFNFGIWCLSRNLSVFSRFFSFVEYRHL